MWATITTALSLLGTIMAYYTGQKKDKAEINEAYQNYIIAKSKWFAQSADERESFEDQEKRMNQMKQQQKEEEEKKKNEILNQ